MTSDVFVAKCNLTGNFIWAKQIVAETKNAWNSAINISDFGNVYISGHFVGTVDFNQENSITFIEFMLRIIKVAAINGIIEKYGDKKPTNYRYKKNEI